MSKLIRAIGFGLVLFPLWAFADEAPVVDASSGGIEVNNTANGHVTSTTIPANNAAALTADSVPAPVAPLSSAEPASLEKIAQQVAYLQQLNLPMQMQQLQQQVQDLRGIVETQSHQLNQIQNQMRSQYADLNNRLSSPSSQSVSGQGGVTAPVTAPINNTTSVPTVSPAIQNSSQEAVPPPPVSKATAERPSDEEIKAYEAAFSQIKAKKYTDAIQSLTAYLQKYPEGTYVANTHYWLGELYSISGANDKATEELMLVATSFSSSDKASNAMLKLGNMAYEQNNFLQAKEWWQKVVKQYPNTAASRIATARLSQLEKSGQSS